MWFSTLRVILPIGISFYTFEAINYTVDVYRRRMPAERNLAHFLLFILFFPHLVAGPIVRARDFLPQIRRPKRWNWYRLPFGTAVYPPGTVQEAGHRRPHGVVSSIRCSPIRERIRPERRGWRCSPTPCRCTAISPATRDMAIGTAHLLGYKLAQNFNMPYVAVNVAEFWRRWHMSLSSWLRDYLFIPLGGSRGGEWKTHRNLFLTMTLCGLWHGAAWPFVGFGVVQALYMMIHRVFHRYCRERPWLDAVLRSLPGTLLRWR